MYCKKCGAPLPENGICLICRTDCSRHGAPAVWTEERQTFCKYCGRKLRAGEICGCRNVSNGGHVRTEGGTRNASDRAEERLNAVLIIFCVILIAAGVLAVVELLSTR